MLKKNVSEMSAGLLVMLIGILLWAITLALAFL